MTNAPTNSRTCRSRSFHPCGSRRASIARRTRGIALMLPVAGLRAGSIAARSSRADASEREADPEPYPAGVAEREPRETAVRRHAPGALRDRPVRREPDPDVRA